MNKVIICIIITILVLAISSFLAFGITNYASDCITNSQSGGSIPNPSIFLIVVTFVIGTLAIVATLSH